MSLFRIGANIQAMDSLRSLYKLNKGIGEIQARLASGKRINTAKDDTAGYAIAKTIQSRKQGLGAALSNVQNARSILAVAEGGYQNQMDILQTIKDKSVQAADDALTTANRNAITAQVFQLLSEFDAIADQTKWKNQKMFKALSNWTFHVGGDEADTLAFALDASISSSETGMNQVATLADGSTGTMAVKSTAAAVITTVDKAIDRLAKSIQKVGDTMVRLTKKENFLSVSIANTDAVRSQYEDADFASEQMELLKLQILQQTAVTSLAQANSSPQVVLGLFR